MAVIYLKKFQRSTFKDDIMATYQEILDDVKKYHKKTIKTCWIAHVKELNGILMRKAPNRISLTSRVHPCPDNIRPIIEASMRRLGMLP